MFSRAPLFQDSGSRWHSRNHVRKSRRAETRHVRGGSRARAARLLTPPAVAVRECASAVSNSDYFIGDPLVMTDAVWSPRDEAGLLPAERWYALQPAPEATRGEGECMGIQ